MSALSAAARRLAAIDPSRAGVGGLRLQLELTLLPDPGATTSIATAATPRAPIAGPPPSKGDSVVSGPTNRARPTAEPAAATRSASAKSTPRERSAATTDKPAPEAPSTPVAATIAPAEAAPASVTPASATPETLAEPLQSPPISEDLWLLRDRWPEIVLRISAHPPTKPLIVACRPISVEGAVVTLGFPEDQGFLRAVADRRRGILEEGIGAVLGRAVTVRCVATNLDLVPEIRSDADAEFVLSEARRIFGTDSTDAAEVG